jgi:hypothetical protein
MSVIVMFTRIYFVNKIFPTHFHLKTFLYLHYTIYSGETMQWFVLAMYLVHRIDIGQKLHSWVKSVPECQPTSGVAAMLKATKPEEIL